MKKIKILFVLPNLSSGGAQRVVKFLFEKLDDTIFEKELIVISPSQTSTYDSPKGKVTFLNKKRVLHSFPKLFQLILKSKPKIVFGTISHVNTILGALSFFFPKTIFIGRHTSISSVYQKEKGHDKKNFFDKVAEKALKKLDYVVCQSNDMAIDYLEVYPIEEKKIKVIHNPITEKFNINPERKDTSNTKIKTFITVGRLVQIKGHKRIINALSRYEKPFKYYMIGDGPLKSEIFEQITHLKLNDKIEHIPFTKNVSEYLIQSDIYLQGSLAEGFPNALLESCAVGTPALAFSSKGGTKDIIENGVNGYIVENENEFLYYLNADFKMDAKVVANSVSKKFSDGIILDQYTNFFRSTINAQNNA